MAAFSYWYNSHPRARRAFLYANIMILLGKFHVDGPSIVSLSCTNAVLGQFVGINGIMYYMSVLMNQGSPLPNTPRPLTHSHETHVPASLYGGAKKLTAFPVGFNKIDATYMSMVLCNPNPSLRADL